MLQSRREPPSVASAVIVVRSVGLDSLPEIVKEWARIFLTPLYKIVVFGKSFISDVSAILFYFFIFNAL